MVSRRSAQLAAETTNWVALGITFIFIGVQLLLFFFQMVTTTTTDFGNPFSGTSNLAPEDIIRKQAGERSASLLAHRIMIHDGDEDGVEEPFKKEIQHSLYCGDTVLHPFCRPGRSPISMEYGDFNDTIWNYASFGVYRFVADYRSGTEIEASRGVEGQVLNASFEVGAYSYEIPMKGGSLAQFAYQVESPNVGGIRWSH